MAVETTTRRLAAAALRLYEGARRELVTARTKATIAGPMRTPLAVVTNKPTHLARAVLAANLETAVNALWDLGPHIGDRIAVVGAGAVGGIFGARLAVAGHDVTFVARGATLAALRSTERTVRCEAARKCVAPR